MKNWKDEEVKALFAEVEKVKREKKAVTAAFAVHAKRFNRKANSVRNYYYHEVDNLSADENRCKKVGIKLDRHVKTHFKSFDKVQEEELFEKIERLLKQGFSVRAACLKISQGDLLLMTRYQNKYQNMKRKLKSHEDNIIQFKQRKLLTESDINSLFLGLVKLIKKTAQDEISQKPNQILEKTTQELQQKNKELLFLKAELEKFKVENKKLLLKLESNKKEALKYHLLKKNVSKEDETQKRV